MEVYLKPWDKRFKEKLSKPWLKSITANIKKARLKKFVEGFGQVLAIDKTDGKIYYIGKDIEARDVEREFGSVEGFFGGGAYYNIDKETKEFLKENGIEIKKV